jgi:hypothetical protein
MFISVPEGKKYEVAQDILNYIYNDFVLTDKVFQGVEHPLYKYFILWEISNLHNMSIITIDDISDGYKVYNNDGTFIDGYDYYVLFQLKSEELFKTIPSEIVSTAKRTSKN